MLLSVIDFEVLKACKVLGEAMLSERVDCSGRQLCEMEEQGQVKGKPKKTSN